MTENTNTNDSTDAQDANYSRGDRFAVKTDPRVAEVVVLDTMTISGYDGVRLAERDAQTGEWAAYPNKAQYLQDEQNLGMVEQVESMDETDVAGVEVALGRLTDAPAAPEGVDEVPSLD